MQNFSLPSVFSSTLLPHLIRHIRTARTTRGKIESVSRVQWLPAPNGSSRTTLPAVQQKTEMQLAQEQEKELEAERARADQIEEERCVVQLQNELLTEMVAAEQVLTETFRYSVLARVCFCRGKYALFEFSEQNLVHRETDSIVPAVDIINLVCSSCRWA